VNPAEKRNEKSETKEGIKASLNGADQGACSGTKRVRILRWKKKNLAPDFLGGDPNRTSSPI